MTAVKYENFRTYQFEQCSFYLYVFCVSDIKLHNILTTLEKVANIFYYTHYTQHTRKSIIAPNSQIKTVSHKKYFSAHVTGRKF